MIKYSQLKKIFPRDAPEGSSLCYTFDQIEEFVNPGLPPEARIDVQWWLDNFKVTKIWLNLGWEVISVNIDKEEVTFKKTIYAKFFKTIKKCCKDV